MLFQPSIQAGDGYKLRIAAVYGGYVNPADAHGPFTAAMAAMPEELCLKTGTFEVWRDLAHSMISVALPDVPRADLDVFARRFEKFNFRVRNFPVPSGEFFTTVEKIYNGTIPTVGVLEDYVAMALETNPVVYGPRAFGVYFRPWAEWKQRMIEHHGTARQAYDWAKAYTHPVRDFWRTGVLQDGSHPLLEPWPADYNFLPLPIHGQIQVDFQLGHPLQPPKVGTLLVANAGLVRAAVRHAFYSAAFDLRQYVQGVDPNMTVTVHCDGGDQQAVQAAFDQGMADVWDEIARGRYAGAIQSAWAFKIFNLVNDRLFVARDGLRTAQFAQDRQHTLGQGPAGKALAANAQCASLDIFIFRATGALSTLTHEAAHALFINHPFWDAERGAADPRRLHVSGISHCTMTTPSRNNNFCGFCMLRLRGWSIYTLDAARATTPIVPVPNPPQPDMHVRTLHPTAALNRR